MLNKIYRFIIRLWTRECPRCPEGRVWYSHEEYHQYRPTLSIYQCDKCGVEVI